MTRSPTTPAAVTGINYPTPIESSSHYDHFSMHHRRQKSSGDPIAEITLSSISSGQRPPGPSHSLSSSTTESTVPSTPVDIASIDNLWRHLRTRKEETMKKDPSKIESFDVQLADPTSPPIHMPPLPMKPDVPLVHPIPEYPTRPLRKKKSLVSYHQRGNDTVVLLDLQGLTKQDVHVSYQRDQIIVTWEFIEEFETLEDGHIVKERRERIHHRTIPLPDGTSFSDVRAGMGSRHLQLRFPNPRRKAVDAPLVDEY